LLIHKAFPIRVAAARLSISKWATLIYRRFGGS
jgi:hypothetical protein